MAPTDDYMRLYKECCEYEENLKKLIANIRRVADDLEADPDSFVFKYGSRNTNRGNNPSAMSEDEWAAPSIMRFLNDRFNRKDYLKIQYAQLSPNEKTQVKPPFGESSAI